MHWKCDDGIKGIESYLITPSNHIGKEQQWVSGQAGLEIWRPRVCFHLSHQLEVCFRTNENNKNSYRHTIISLLITKYYFLQPFVISISCNFFLKVSSIPISLMKKLRFKEFADCDPTSKLQNMVWYYFQFASFTKALIIPNKHQLKAVALVYFGGSGL